MLDYLQKDNTLIIRFSGDFTGFDQDKSPLFTLAEAPKIKEIVFDCQNLKKWDSTLVVILHQISLIARRRKDTPSLDFSSLPDNLKHLLDLALSVNRNPNKKSLKRFPFFEAVGEKALFYKKIISKGLGFIAQCVSSLVQMLKGKAIFRKVDFLFALEACSYKALGIVSLVSFMVGLILAFVGAIQLQLFGVEIYVASLVAIGMTRIMGAIMAGIVMSGRTGASYAATLGTMQVNEEIDALRTMGIPVTDFLVLPRITSLILTMPLLTMLSDFMGMLGGAFVGIFMLDISPNEYFKYTFDALNMRNFTLGLFHGLVYGVIIALCGCYYGINCGKNADSVGLATTKSVVASIVWMIVITGVLTVVIEGLGL